MVNRERYSAWRIGRIGAVLLLLILHSGVVYAEFEPKTEYQSIIATDPKISQVFRQLFLGMNKPQVDRVAEGVFLARGFGQGNAVTIVDGVCRGVDEDCVVLSPSSLGERTDVLLERVYAVTQLPGEFEVESGEEASA